MFQTNSSFKLIQCIFPQFFLKRNIEIHRSIGILLLGDILQNAEQPSQLISKVLQYKTFMYILMHSVKLNFICSYAESNPLLKGNFFFFDEDQSSEKNILHRQLKPLSFYVCFAYFDSTGNSFLTYKTCFWSALEYFFL